MEPYCKNDRVTLYHGDCREIIPALNLQFDAIITDPPYCMLKIDWDKEDVFLGLIPTIASVMKKSSSVVFFGRGDSAYRQNIAWSEEGFDFKEEIVWDKRMPSSPLNAIQRRHELISIRAREKTLNKIRIEMEDFELVEANKVATMMRFIREGITGRNFQEVKNYINENISVFEKKYKSSGLSVSSSIKSGCRNITAIKSALEGVVPISIMPFPRTSSHGNWIHPTKKPSRLMAILIRLCTNTEDLVIDPFGGSGSTGIAAIKTGRRAILIEQDETYCEIAARRIEKEAEQPELFGAKEQPTLEGMPCD